MNDLGDWEKGPHGEVYRVGKLGEYGVKLRSIIGGDNGFRPVVEITTARAARKTGPRGGESMSGKWVDGTIGWRTDSHRGALAQGLSWLRKWVPREHGKSPNARINDEHQQKNSTGGAT